MIFDVFEIIDNSNFDYILIENVPMFLQMYFPYEGKILLLKNILEIKYGNKYNINIVVPPDFDKKQLVKNPNFKYLEQGISLHEYLFITAKSSIVLDIQIIYQKGFTFRIFEATHYKKKIITTDPKVKELEFYHPDNILIFTENTSSEEITIFLTKPYHPIDENLINKYRLDYWLENRIISHQNG